MRVLLIRHGEAEERAKNGQDSMRALTIKGIDQFKHVALQVDKLILEGSKVLLWSSPLLRATQSAELLVNGDKINQFEIKDFILDGNFDQLSTEVEGLSSETTLIIVGHEPHIGHWANLIGNVKFQIKKGSITGFDIEEKKPLKGNLNWFLVPKMKSNLAVLEIKSALSHINNLNDKLYQTFIQNDEDVEALHKLRVGIRRYRSIMSFSKPLLTGKLYNENQNQLRECGQIFAYLRELDVLEETWHFMFTKFNLDDLNTDTLSLLLAKKRVEEKVSIHQKLIKKDLKKTFDKNTKMLNEWIRKFDFTQQEEFESYYNIQLNSWMSKLNKQLNKINRASIKEIHMTRILCKKIRYVIETFDGTIRSADANETIKKLKEIQDLLGTLCDIMKNKTHIKTFSKTDNFSMQPYKKGLWEGYQNRKFEQVMDELLSYRDIYK